jgi:hypothetical protein
VALVAVMIAGCGQPAAPAGSFAPTLDGNRDRLLETYLLRLKSIPDARQSNGLVGGALDNVCDLWARLDPSSRLVFLTLTHRMQGSTLRDGSHVLDHVVKLYRVSGGRSASASAAGSCGGAEYNRMIMSMDSDLHAAQVAANVDRGALGRDYKRDIADIPPASFWRNSHDLAGPHKPFTASDETNAGAPRGQTQYFFDPASTRALSALGRLDVADVVDPFALEMDQDYDCVHHSNPACPYRFYGRRCLPRSRKLGTAIYWQYYGNFVPAWQPTGCSLALADLTVEADENDAVDDAD